MSRLSLVAVAVVLAVVVVFVNEAPRAEAVTCNPTELSPCLPAITSGSAPTKACCAKVTEQKPCLCGYLRNPNLRQFVNSPNARKVAATCGVPYPQC